MLSHSSPDLKGMQSPLLKNPQPAGLLLIWWPVFLALGIGAYFLFPVIAAGHYLGLRLFLCAIIIFMAPYIHYGRIHWTWHAYPVGMWLIHGVMAMTLGLALISYSDKNNMILPLTEPVFGRVMTGHVESSEMIDGGWRVVLGQVSIAPHKQDHAVRDPQSRYRVRVAIRHADYTPVIGSTITIKASLIPPSSSLLPGMFDFKRHAHFQRLSAYGYSMSPVTLVEDAQKTWPSLLERYRQYLAERVALLMQDMDFEPHQSVVGLTMALLNGQRAGIDKISSAHMQRSGLQHLISISGYHVSLMAGIIFFAVRFLLALSMQITLRYPIKKIAAMVALIGIILYMCVVGFTAPTVRSVIMSGVVLLAVMMDREAITVRMVALSALLILVIQPESLITPGFQMSFAAVAALVVFYQKTQIWWLHSFWRSNIITRLLFVLAGSVGTTMVATIATAPFAVYHFQQLPMLSVIANMLVTPVMGLIVMPASILVYPKTIHPVVSIPVKLVSQPHD